MRRTLELVWTRGRKLYAVLHNLKPFLSANFNSELVNPNSFTRLTSWPMTVKSSVKRDVREEMLEIVMTAMEKFHWDTSEIPNYLKRELDTRFGCSWHVVVGEEFGFDVDFEVI